MMQDLDRYQKNAEAERGMRLVFALMRLFLTLRPTCKHNSPGPSLAPARRVLQANAWCLQCLQKGPVFTAPISACGQHWAYLTTVGVAENHEDAAVKLLSATVDRSGWRDLLLLSGEVVSER